MQSEDINFPFPICANVPPDIGESSTIIEEGPRICPLCNSIVRQYFINFHEKIQMCENLECEFPFGHEDLQFMRHDLEYNDEDDIIESNRSSASCTTSVISAAVLADIDKIDKVYESEDSQFDVRLQPDVNDRDKNLEVIRKEREIDISIKNTVRNIRSMTNELKQSTDDIKIQDEKFINSLMNLQGKFGGQLLNDDEMIRVKKKEPVIGLGELKIDIGDTGDNVPTITIEISGQGKDQNDAQEK